MKHTDVVIAGGGFAGLACAKSLAEQGIGVTLLERKAQPGIGMHTTGIIVKECADEFAIPEPLTRKVTKVRLYAPNMRFTELASDDYFFLTTDTPALMRHLSDEATAAGAELLYDTPYRTGKLRGDMISVNDNLSCNFLIGADGPRSKVADDFALGQNTAFLLGAEAEYTGLPLEDDGAFYCFLNQQLAYGYLGWVIPGVGVTQVGLAQRMPKQPDIKAFVEQMRGHFDFTTSDIAARRGGLIPVGGLVEPFTRDNVLLLGDAAGMVSPLTAGGIHTALRYGKCMGAAIADHLNNGAPHPSTSMTNIYPRFHFKQLLRKTYEYAAPDWLLNLLIGNPLFSTAASAVFFTQKRLK